MVWGRFIGDKLGPLVFLDRTVDESTYVQVLEQNLLAFVDHLKENGVANIIFNKTMRPLIVPKMTMDWVQAAATSMDLPSLNFRKENENESTRTTLSPKKMLHGPFLTIPAIPQFQLLLASSRRMTRSKRVAV